MYAFDPADLDSRRMCFSRWMVREIHMGYHVASSDTRRAGPSLGCSYGGLSAYDFSIEWGQRYCAPDLFMVRTAWTYY